MFKKILLFSIMLLMAAVFTFIVKSEAKMARNKINQIPFFEIPFFDLFLSKITQKNRQRPV